VGAPNTLLFLPVHRELLSVFLKLHVAATRNKKKCQYQSAVAMTLALTIGIVSCRGDSLLLYSIVMKDVIVFLLKLQNMEQSF
jgi:hypothetical protein